MSKIVHIGLTGGIGSGKTTIGKVFQKLGIPLYVSDIRSKLLLHEDRGIQEQLNALVKEDVFPNGELNRKRFGEILFADEGLKKEVEAIIHPAVARDFADWAARQTAPYVLKEAAILFETGSYLSLDATILVTAPKTVRMGRVLARDSHLTRETLQARMQQQWTDEQKRQLANYWIINDGATFLLPQIIQCHEAIIRSTTTRG
ncbi:MAG: dephospho-CoA kinase [Schleiferiaceae bacterium]|nr:dephospho-CoA kinase [Schleiferiaceae bacterium]